MSYRKIFWGVLLVIIGILFILKNTGVILFSWHTIWHLWPVLLILWGISLIPIKDWIKLVLSLATVLVTFVTAQQYTKNHPDEHKWNWEWNDGDSNSNDEVVEGSIDKTLTEKYDSTITSAMLVMNIGAGEFNIKDTASDLINVSHNNSGANYSMETTRQDSSCKIKLQLDKGKFKSGRMDNSIEMKLNPNPVWDMELNVGAAEVNFDLTPFKMRTISVQGGASDMELKLAATLPNTDVSIEAGMADITVKVPQDAGVEIISNTFLASKEFEGFVKTDKQHYKTPGFDKSTNRIKINIKAGMASVDVVRY